MLFFIILLLISIIIELTYFLFVLDSLFLGNSLATSFAARKKIIELIARRAPTSNKLYDLGCAYGDFAIKLNEDAPHFQITAVDDNCLRLLIAKIKKWLTKSQVTFKKENLFNTNLQKAEIIYTYLPRALMPRLEEKLLNELPSGAIVITNSTYFPFWRPQEMVYLPDDKLKSAPIFVYKVGTEHCSVPTVKIAPVGSASISLFRRR